MPRKNALSKVALGFAATSAAGIIALGSLGGQSPETESDINTIARGSVKEYFSLESESEVTESGPSYEITEPVTISPETTAPPETTVETAMLMETTAVTTTSPSQTTTTATHIITAFVSSPKAEYKVYWVEDGKVWHSTKSCRTLKKSTSIYSGTITESGKERACKVCD